MEGMGRFGQSHFCLLKHVCAIQEAMDHGIIAGQCDENARIAQALGVQLALIAQWIIVGSNDERWREVVKLFRSEWEGIRGILISAQREVPLIGQENAFLFY